MRKFGMVFGMGEWKFWTLSAFFGKKIEKSDTRS
jgi:hypothetical protein